MYNKLFILSPYFIPPKEIGEELKKKEGAKPVFNQFFVTENYSPYFHLFPNLPLKSIVRINIIVS